MKKISYLELSSLILIIVISMYSGININILKEDVGINSWIAVILSYIIGFIPVLLIIYISKYKEKLNLFEKIKNLYGKIFGNIINIFISLILLIIGITLLYNVTSFTTTQFLFRTPLLISSILLILLVIYNVNKEISVISHVSLILMLLNFTLFIISFISLTQEGHLDNLLPILKENTNNIFFTSIKIASMNTLPLITILIIPKEQITNQKKYNKTIILSYLLGSIISLLVVIGTISVLGIYLVKFFEFPEYAVLKKVKLFGFLERIENIVAIQWIIGNYMYLTIIIYCISKSISNNSKKVFKYTSIITGLIIVIASKYLFKNITIFNTYIKNIFPYIISSLIIVYILIIIKIFIDKRKTSNSKPNHHNLQKTI